MKMIKCDACGGNDFIRFGNTCECSFCGSKYLLDECDNLMSKELTNASIIALLENSNKLHEQSKYSEELDLLIKALKLDETNARTMVKLGRCYRCLNLPDQAIECYQRTVELNPNEGAAYTNMGTIHILRQNYEEAAKCYEKGLPFMDKATFDYWVSYANYAVVVAKLGNPKRAEEILTESEAHGYKNGETIRKLAGIEKKSLTSKIKALFS